MFLALRARCADECEKQKLWIIYLRCSRDAMEEERDKMEDALKKAKKNWRD